MKCDEIREHLIDLLYDEAITSPEKSEAQEHLRICPSCRLEFQELQQTQRQLRIWKDESPMHSVPALKPEPQLSPRVRRNYWRYAAMAAAVLICFLIFADAEITWNKSGFSYRSHLLSRSAAGQDYYTKGEVRELLKSALDDSELRTSEVSYMMARKIMDAIERERWMDARLQNQSGVRNRN